MCFFNDTATTEIYTLSLHDALPIFEPFLPKRGDGLMLSASDIETYRTCPLKYKFARVFRIPQEPDRKSTRLNSSHANISYAVFCLKKNKLYFSCSCAEYAQASAI